MERLAGRIADNIAAFLKCDEEKRAVIAYGLHAIMHTSFTVAVIILLGIIAGTPAEILIVCFSAIILRKYSGGAHADTSWLCTAVSAVYCLLTALIAVKLLSEIYYPPAMAAAAVFVYGAAFLTVYRKAPVDSPHKPIRSAGKKKKMRRGSFIVLSAYLIISALFFVLGYKYERLNSYGISMLFGISWQIFTLTGSGSILLMKLNDLFIRKEMKQ